MPGAGEPNSLSENPPLRACNRLHAETDTAIDPRLSVGDGIVLTQGLEAEVMSHFPEIRALLLGLRTAEESSA